jgi:hypothetical protein
MHCQQKNLSKNKDFLAALQQEFSDGVEMISEWL